MLPLVWTALGAFLILIGIAAVCRLWLRPRALDQSRCARCRYPRESLGVGSPCPECGLSEEQDVRRRRDALTRLGLTETIAAALVAIWVVGIALFWVAIVVSSN